MYLIIAFFSNNSEAALKYLAASLRFCSTNVSLSRINPYLYCALPLLLYAAFLIYLVYSAKSTLPPIPFSQHLA